MRKEESKKESSKATELAAAVEAAVETQLNKQDLSQQSQPLVPPFQGIIPAKTTKNPTSL